MTAVLTPSAGRTRGTATVASASRLLAGGLAAALALLPLAAHADTLVDNVNGISVDRQGKVTRFVAMVIDEQGRVARLLERRTKPSKDIKFREDGRGRTVIPGIVDGHARLMALGLTTLSVDLTGTRSLQEAQARLLAYAQEHPDRPWIIGFGWDQDKWGLGRFPTAAEIDAVVPNRPVWLERADGEAGWANSRALAAGQITAQSADPPGGRIERLGGSRTPSGVILGTARQAIERQIPPARSKDRDLALHTAQAMLIEQGVTAVTDMGTSIEDWMAYRRAGDEGRLRLRIIAYADSVPTMLLVGGTGPTPWLYDDKLRLNGIALRTDGALGSRGALLKAPYADAPGTTGLEIINGTQLRNLISRAAMDGFQVAIASSGDAAVAETLASIEELSGDYRGDRRWRVEHAQSVDPADVRRFGRNGIIASMQPLHQIDGRLVAEARLGPARLAGAHAWNSLARAGAPLVFGTGAPAHRPSPFAGMAAAISREDEAGQPFGGWQPQERVTREQALAAFTAASAYAGFAEGRFGRLERGERADFIVLDRDPLLAAPAELRAIRVLETWIGGRKIHEAGRRSGTSPSR